MLPPHGARVIDANPAIIPASQITVIYCLGLCEYKFNFEYFV